MNANLKMCTYCRVIPAEHRDHVIPTSFARVKRTYRQKDTVPSCAECNYLLSAVPIFSIGQRADYLIEKYRVRYAKLLMSPDWTDEELEELGPTLKLSIKHQLLEKARIEAKLDGLHTVASTRA